jgi:predicted ferric reductase
MWLVFWRIGLPSRSGEQRGAFRLPALLASQLQSGKPDRNKVHTMLYTIAVVLLILWVLGLVSSYTLGGFIHILLVIAVVMILVNLISGRRAL